MAKTEWYRRRTWTTADQADFAAHLKRSRGPFHQAQYLRIQASYLQDEGSSEMLRAALALLDDLLKNYRDEFSVGTAFLQKAQCLEALGRPEEALQAYRESLAAQRANPNVRDSAYLGFGELILRLKRKDLYTEALAALEEFGGAELFPLDQYRYNTIRAFALDRLGRPAEARLAARMALDASSKTQSAFRYNRKLGVVHDPALQDQQKLVALAR